MISNSDNIVRDFLLGFIKIHILHHAGREPVYGSWLLSELGRHGYTLSPGTLYPVLHGLEKSGYLSRSEEIVDGKVRKYYHITPAGRSALHEAREKMSELISEVLRE